MFQWIKDNPAIAIFCASNFCASVLAIWRGLYKFKRMDEEIVALKKNIADMNTCMETSDEKISGKFEQVNNNVNDVKLLMAELIGALNQSGIIQVDVSKVRRG